ncbi:hypothetical protein V8C86DRAFT_2519435 [Haematococcus lacustris]
MDLGADLQAQREEFSRKKVEEARIESGEAVTLHLSLPDGSTASIRVPSGATVAYLKLLIEQQHGIPVTKCVLRLAGKAMLDPFSLCDCCPTLIAGAEAKIDVEHK